MILESNLVEKHYTSIVKWDGDHWVGWLWLLFYQILRERLLGTFSCSCWRGRRLHIEVKMQHSLPKVGTGIFLCRLSIASALPVFPNNAATSTTSLCFPGTNFIRTMIRNIATVWFLILQFVCMFDFHIATLWCLTYLIQIVCMFGF